MNTLIQLDDIHFRIASHEDEPLDILRGITFEIKAGSFIGILGENGSGKTTLLKHINGILLPTTGKVLIDGLDTRQQENQRKLRSLVGMVFQNPADQVVSSTVEEDIAFGLENSNMPTGDIRKIVHEQLNLAGLKDFSQRPPYLLSGGQVQRLALAGVMARQPRVILFDEPTSMLDPIARDNFLKRLLGLRDQGITIIYVTHRTEELIDADRIVVLHEGRVKLYGSPEEVYKQERILYEIGLEVPKAFQLAGQFRQLGWNIPADVLSSKDLIETIPEYQGIPNPVRRSATEPVGDHLITAYNAHYTYLPGTPLAQPALTGANLEVKRHHVHGIAGTNGSGKSTLLQHFNGILRPDSGTVFVDGLAVHDPRTSLQDIVRKAGLVFQNPETQFFEVYVGDEIAYGPKRFGLDDLRSRVRQAMALVGLDFERFKDRRLDTLSGGEKRKAALASTLVLDQDILLFDEPTAGMDPRARQEVLKLFIQLSHAGKTLVIASHQLEELASVSHDISLMQSGRVISTSHLEDRLFDLQAVTLAGLLPPLAVQISQALIEKGWPIAGRETSTPDRLISALQEVSI